MIDKVDSANLVYNRSIQGLCKLPFYNHAKGCPNFGKKDGCPPGLPLIDEVFDFDSDMYVIYTTFQVGEFAERMKSGDPEWS